MAIFFLGGFFQEQDHIVSCTCPNDLGVGAIDRPDPFEQVFDPCNILKVLGIIFVDEFSIIEPQKSVIYGSS